MDTQISWLLYSPPQKTQAGNLSPNGQMTSNQKLAINKHPARESLFLVYDGIQHFLLLQSSV